MKDYLRQILQDVDNNLLAVSTVREYLQARVLQVLQDCGAFGQWVFHGGTSLRFLYGAPRYSEDLDFALRAPGLEDDFAGCLKRIRRTFEDEGYDADVKLKDEKTVKAAFIRFRALLFELGLSPHVSQALQVRIELDTNPPAGGAFATSVIRRHVTVRLLHYDKPSLLAGKLHAILARPYAKGRDLYDLLWYLSDRSWPGPNVAFLNHALAQTGWDGPEIAGENWRSQVSVRLEEIDWPTVRADVQPFLEREADVALLTHENVLSLLK